MNIIKKFYGDINTCSKYYYGFALKQANTMENDNGRVYSTILNGNDIKGKPIQVFIKIRIDLPDCHIIVMSATNLKTGNLCSGLSIFELQDQTFNQFYPRDGNGFQNFSPLVRDSNLSNSLPYFTKYNNKIVNQNHYINGKQFSGNLSKQVQQQIGTTNIDVKYQSQWNHSNGIYKDSAGKSWLITIKNGGVYGRVIDTVLYTDSTITKLNNSSVKVTSELFDGEGYKSTDLLLLSFTQFHSNSFALSLNQGWSFNKKGNKIQNISFKYTLNDKKLNAFRYEITIDEQKINNTIKLNVSYNIVESGSIQLHNFLSFMSPIYNDNNNYSTEKVDNLNYSQVKYNPLGKIELDITTIDDIINPFNTKEKEFKIPLQCYFDDNDKIKVIYYYMGISHYETEITSNSGFTQESDFQNGFFQKIGDLSFGYGNSTNYALNNKLKHGIMINNDSSLLAEDNLGEKVIYQQSLLPIGSMQTNFAYLVENDQLSLDLKQYRNFDIKTKFDLFNNKILAFQSTYNNFYQSYINTKFINKNNLLIGDDYVLDKQFEEIRNSLSFDDRFKEISSVNSLLDINKIDILSYKNIDLPYLLYELNPQVLTIFQTLNDSYRDMIYDKIDTINNTLNTYMQSTYLNYYNGFKTNYKSLFSYLKNNQDKRSLNISYVNSLIENLNNNHIPLINDMINDINQVITEINNNIEIIYIFVNTVKKYNNIVDTYIASIKSYRGIYLEDSNMDVIISITETERYYTGKKVYYLKNKIKKSYKNRELTSFSLIFNNGNRDSLSVYSQKNTYNDIIIEQDNMEYMSLTTSNEFALYKQKRTYIPGSGTDIIYGDFELVDTFYNVKDFHFTDMGGNDIFIRSGDNRELDNPMTDELSFNENNLYNSNIYYKNIYLLENFITISKDLAKFGDSISTYAISQGYNDYIPTLENKIITIDKEIINSSTNAKNDYRLIHYKSQDYPSLKTNFYNLKIDYYNQLYFNMFRDSYSFNYCLSKDIYNSYDSKLSLTNISKYIIMDYHYVNFIGQAFDEK